MSDKITNRVIIIHGWQGTPQSNWFPWLKEQLEKIGCEVIVPAMPNADNPDLAEWLACIAENIGQTNIKTFLVGHSLGAAAILRYLEILPENEKIGGVIMVAGFSVSINYAEPDSFVKKPMDYGHIKKASLNFIAIHSDNDRYVALSQGEILRDELGAELIVLKNASHINESAGFLQLPIVLDKLKELMKIKPKFTPEVQFFSL